MSVQKWVGFLIFVEFGHRPDHASTNVRFNTRLSAGANRRRESRPN